MSRIAAPSEKTHSRLSPSGSSRWLACPGSISLCESLNIPEESNEAADEGTAAHTLLENALTKNRHPEAFRGKKIGAFEVNDDMINNVGDVFDYVMSVQKDHGGNMAVEVALDIEMVGGGGTADVVIYGKDSIHVMDLKYGKGVPVDVVGNSQLMLYLIGATKKFNARQTTRLFLHIMQPRCPHPDGPMRSCEIPREELYSFASSTLKIVKEIEGGTTRLCPGEKQCRWCKANGQCPALAKRCIEEARQEFSEFMDPNAEVKERTPTRLTNEQLAVCLSRIDLLKVWIGAVESRALSLLAEGKHIPGYKLVEGKSNRRWADEGETAKALAKLNLDIDDYMPRSLVGIGAVEKLLKKSDALAPFLKKYTVRPEGRPTVALVTDPRPPISAATAADDFKDLL